MSGMKFSGRSTPSLRVAALVPLVLLVAGGGDRSSPVDQSCRVVRCTRMLQASALPADASAGYKYLGPGSCSASACHGGIQARDTTKVLQNEYSTWIVQDRHSRAYTVLTQPLANRMAKILKIGPPTKPRNAWFATRSPCRRVSAARNSTSLRESAVKAATARPQRGSGPTSKQTPNMPTWSGSAWSTIRTSRSAPRSCLTCHLGAPGLEVDHEMLAAGHPDLTFELDSFSSIEPPHWVEKAPDSKLPINENLFGVRIWSIGQATQLQQSMARLRASPVARYGPSTQRWTASPATTASPSRRTAGGNRRVTGRAGRGIHPTIRRGMWSSVTSARRADPTTDAELEPRPLTDDFRTGRRTSARPRRSWRPTRDRGAQLAGELTAEMRNMTYDRAQTEQLMREIANDADGISLDGERSAEQAAMALDSLYLAYAKLGNAKLRPQEQHRPDVPPAGQPLRLQRAEVCCANEEDLCGNSSVAGVSRHREWGSTECSRSNPPDSEGTSDKGAAHRE